MHRMTCSSDLKNLTLEVYYCVKNKRSKKESLIIIIAYYNLVSFYIFPWSWKLILREGVTETFTIKEFWNIEGSIVGSTGGFIFGTLQSITFKYWNKRTIILFHYLFGLSLVSIFWCCTMKSLKRNTAAHWHYATWFSTQFDKIRFFWCWNQIDSLSIPKRSSSFVIKLWVHSTILFIAYRYLFLQRDRDSTRDKDRDRDRERRHRDRESRRDRDRDRDKDRSRTRDKVISTLSL